MSTPPVVLATGDILVGIDDGTVAAVSSAGVLRWRWTPDSEWPSPASRLVATPVGTFAQLSSRLYLLTTAGPSASAWPQAGGCTGVTGQACEATEGGR